MATVIRLKRMGTKKKPFYRLVVTDSRKAVSGKFIEAIGYYDPRKAPKTININEEKALEWLKKGAKPSDTVRGLFRSGGILTKFKAGTTKEVPKSKDEIQNSESSPIETTPNDQKKE